MSRREVQSDGLQSPPPESPTAVAVSIRMRWPGLHTGGIGRFDDGRIAEIFINGAKAGTAAETNAQDAAIVASLALQHGCPVETIQHALARSGGAAGPLAALLREVDNG
jgi:hypothetical protein